MCNLRCFTFLSYCEFKTGTVITGHNTPTICELWWGRTGCYGSKLFNRNQLMQMLKRCKSLFDIQSVFLVWLFTNSLFLWYVLLTDRISSLSSTQLLTCNVYILLSYFLELLWLYSAFSRSSSRITDVFTIAFALPFAVSLEMSILSENSLSADRFFSGYSDQQRLLMLNFASFMRFVSYVYTRGILKGITRYLSGRTPSTG